MRKYISESLLIILPGFILFMISCTAGSCFEETESYLKASFYTGEGTPKITAPDTLTLYGLNNDSIIYNKSAKIQPALIPLNSSTDSCTFIIKINGVTDTIKIQYSSYPHLISKECGYTFYHNLDSLTFTRNGIDSISKIKNNITTLNEENIRIFY